LTDGADMLYNKFKVESVFPPDKPLQHPNTDYNCVVATTGHWKVSRCDDRHHVVCQSQDVRLTDTMATSSLIFSLPHSGQNQYTDLDVCHADRIIIGQLQHLYYVQKNWEPEHFTIFILFI